MTPMKKERIIRELNQEQVARIMQVSQSNYSKYEKGILYPPLEKLIVLADFYNVSLDYLIGRQIFTK